jgi:VWFA-related protein
VTDLTIQDFEVLEDNVPQRLESFELIKPRGPAPANARVEPSTVAESRAMATDRDSRLFVLFLDTKHVQLAGSFRAQRPIINLLDKVIGQDDMVGVMTPDMSARNLTLARRTESIENILKNNWSWGERDRLNTTDPREREIEQCYDPDLAYAIIQRRRERMTLDAIEDLIIHLEGLREERKFVLMLTEGWLLPGRDDRLSAPVDGRVPVGARIGVGATGQLTTDDPRRMSNIDACDRERTRLAAEDLQSDYLLLLNRANRANVSFYPIDFRGLVVFDEPIGPRRPPPPSVDASRLRARHDALRTLAEQTDGFAILDTNAVDKALERMVEDTRAYYLLGYYSTNTRPDGRFRKLTVRVKRPDVQVRARPGYLAPTEEEMAAAMNVMTAAAAPALPPGFARAMERLAPVRGNVPLRVHSSASPHQIWLTGEFDAATVKLPEWQQGGVAHIVFEHERGASAAMEIDVPVAPGQRMFQVTPPTGSTVAPGRYVIRLQLTPKGGALPLQTTVDVTVPDADAALLSQSGLAARRGPSTGLQYVPTADARYRRTERLRFEVPRLTAGGTASARLLGRDAQPLGVAVTLSERVEESSQARLIVADVTLAALAQGEYVLEVTLEDGGKKESASYGFRLVP